jgi:hypothetical protein
MDDVVVLSSEEPVQTDHPSRVQQDASRAVATPEAVDRHAAVGELWNDVVLPRQHVGDVVVEPVVVTHGGSGAEQSL